MSTVITSSDDPELKVARVENINRLVWRLAWPTVVLQAVQSINTILDVFYVGEIENSSALTASGAGATISFLIFALAVPLTVSTTALVSRAFGSGDIEGCKKITRQSVQFGFYASICIAMILLLSFPFAANAMIPKSDPDAREMFLQYCNAMVIGLPGLIAIEILAGALNGIGKTKAPMLLSGLQMALQMSLNTILIHNHELGIGIKGLGLGLPGAGYAMSISQWAAAIGYFMWVKRSVIGNCFNIALPQLEAAKKIVTIASPSLVTWLLRVGTQGVFTTILTNVPNSSHAIAAMRGGFAIESIAFLPAFGMGVAGSVLVGQSLGQNNSTRAYKLGWYCSHTAAIITGLISLLIIIFAGPISNILITGKPEVSAILKGYIYIIFASEVFFAYALGTAGAMQGAGDTIRPFFNTVLSLWVVRLPLTYFLAVTMELGALGCWIGMSSTQVLQGVISILQFKSGAWRNTKI